jgi:hypothetical protein
MGLRRTFGTLGKLAKRLAASRRVQQFVAGRLRGTPPFAPDADEGARTWDDVAEQIRRANRRDVEVLRETIDRADTDPEPPVGPI